VKNLLGVALVIALAGTGCAPSLAAQSAAPPGRTARLDEVNGTWTVQSYRLELSAGVAIALTCYAYSPCEHMVASSDDPKVAEVRAGSLGALERIGAQNSAGMVIVGKAAGTTKVRMRSKNGNREIAVTIVPAPEPAAQATIAN
jgi:hypothetical protein